MAITTLTEEQIYIIRTVAKIISSISIFGSVFVFIIYCIYKEIRQIALELVVWLCISVVLFSITSFLPYESNSPNTFWCALQSWMITSFQNSSIMWCTVIGFTAYIGVNQQGRLESNENKFRMIFLIIALVSPMLLSSM